MRKIKTIFIIALVVTASVLFGVVKNQRGKIKNLESNNNALLVGVEDLMVDNEKIGVKVGALEMSLSKYKKYYSEQADSLKKMGVKLKDVQAVASHYMEINAELKGQVKDTTVKIINDTISVILPAKKIVIDYRPDLYIAGLITGADFNGKIKIPVQLGQVVEAEYRRKFLWWRWGLVGFRQKVFTNNKYVDIQYSEFIKIKK